MLSLKPSSYLELLVNQFSNATPENSNGPEKISSSKYHIEEMHNIELTQKNKLLSVFHIKVFHSIKVLLTFNILSNTKKIWYNSNEWNKNHKSSTVSLSNNLNLNNYSFEFILTETSAGGSLLYIANHLS